MPRQLSNGDRALWESYARGLNPLKGRSRPAAPLPTASASATADRGTGERTRTDGAAPGPSTSRPWQENRVAAPRRPASPLTVGAQPGGLDTATWQRFRTGKLPVVRTLDLHGMTVQQAHDMLISFIRSAHADQVRHVEIVTGRGSGQSGGAIRREFPHWLNRPDIRPLILGAAHPHAMNPGSVRLMLRRIR